MSFPIAQEYLCIGGNRNSTASCWSQTSGLLAFGADQNVALWDPLDPDTRGIQHVLHGHQDKVTSVTFLSHSLYSRDAECVISGSADGKICVWLCNDSQSCWKKHCVFDAHKGAVNCIYALNDTDYFVSGGADGVVKLWMLSDGTTKPILTIPLKPRLIPLTLVLSLLPTLSCQEGVFLAVGGTRNDVQVYAIKDLAHNPAAELHATLKGHESWIHCLSLKIVSEHECLLASASHDKYVRLWKFEHGKSKPTSTVTNGSGTGEYEQALTAKVQKVGVADSSYSITFEALLLGHEDWVYSAAWNPAAGSDQLLTASADGTLTIWELDSASGIWISISKLGEISGQKGATTATGSSGGFWTGLWSPDGQWVTCLGRTGSWRIWNFDARQQYWVQKHGISGHTASANGLTWSLDGGYLLSTSSDQTTRLHAEWRRNRKRTWHEFSRPQIHGYDLNCVSSTGDYQFTSGADEKLLRVFNEPKDIARMLKNLAEINEPKESDLSDNAAIPVLGLSNKAMVDGEDQMQEFTGNKDQEYVAPDLGISVTDIVEPPTEDLLARHTLWPEHEKLYGHGYEISESAYSPSNRILATACKASSVDHAVVRLYSTQDWNEIKPPLTAHSLTVTRLVWAHTPYDLLLSVGRDRQWFIFHKAVETSQSWKILLSNPKAHSRMILDAAWVPSITNERLFFATAGRDKLVKTWLLDQTEGMNRVSKFEEGPIVKRESAVTAVDFTGFTFKNEGGESSKMAVLACGEESGALSIHVFVTAPQKELTVAKTVEVSREISPSKAVTRILWRPCPGRGDLDEDDSNLRQLAVAAADGSVIVLSIGIGALCGQAFSETTST